MRFRPTVSFLLFTSPASLLSCKPGYRCCSSCSIAPCVIMEPWTLSQVTQGRTDVHKASRESAKQKKKGGIHFSATNKHKKSPRIGHTCLRMFPFLPRFQLLQTTSHSHCSSLPPPPLSLTRSLSLCHSLPPSLTLPLACWLPL